MKCKYLVALPVYNEVNTVCAVLDEVAQHADEILVVNDGSSDGSADLLAQRSEQQRDIHLISHETNKGYGAALVTAFEFAIKHNYDVLVTIDCDGQHQPQRIKRFVAAIQNTGADIVSGSRYLKSFDSDTPPPIERRQINHVLTQTLNDRLGFGLTDAFCGFKAYRVEALKRMNIQETGYAMPLELWVQAACAKLTVVEVAVPLIYLDETRSFGGELDQASIRLKYYHDVLNRAFAALPPDCPKLRGERVG